MAVTQFLWVVLIATAVDSQFYPGFHGGFPGAGVGYGGGFGGIGGIGGIPGYHAGFGYDPFYTFEHHYPARRTTHYRRRRRGPEPEQEKSIFDADSLVSELEMNETTFYPNENATELWLVMFHTRVFKKSAQSLVKLAKGLEGKCSFRVATFNCKKNKEHETYCKNRIGSMKDLPRFVFIANGKFDFYTGDHGDVSARKLYNFSMRHFPRYLVENFESKEGLNRALEKQITQAKKAAVVLLSEKAETSTLYHSLAYKYREHFLFAESRRANPDTAQILSLPGDYPKLAVFIPEEDEREGLYDVEFVVSDESPLKCVAIVNLLDNLLYGEKTAAQQHVSPREPVPPKDSTMKDRIDGKDPPLLRMYHDPSVDADVDSDEVSGSVETLHNGEDEVINLDNAQQRECNDDDATPFYKHNFDRDDENLISFDDEDVVMNLLDEIHLKYTTPSMIKVAKEYVSGFDGWFATTAVAVTTFFVVVVSTRMRPNFQPVAESGDLNRTSPIANLVAGMLHVHHHYLAIARYTFARVLVLVPMALVMVRLAVHEHGESSMIVLLTFLGDFGELFSNIYLFMVILCVDFVGLLYGVLAKAIKFSLIGLSLQGNDSVADLYRGFFIVPLETLAEANKILERLLMTSGTQVPKTDLSSAFFTFYHPAGFGGVVAGLPGGFGSFGGPMIPGFPAIHHHHPTIHHHNIPGGFIYDLVEPSVPEQVLQQEAEDAHSEFDFLFLLVAVLIVAPIFEEIVFRFMFSLVRSFARGVRSMPRLFRFTKSKLNRSKSNQEIPGFHPWEIVASVAFAASHLSNHLPSEHGVVAQLLREEGTEFAERQLVLALTQTFIAFFISLFTFVPLYNRLGLVATIGAHISWNFCALFLFHQISLRCLFLLFVSTWSLTWKCLSWFSARRNEEDTYFEDVAVERANYLMKEGELEEH